MKKPKDIQTIRNQIDKIDSQLIKLLVRRFDLVKIIGQIKSDNKLKVIDSDREQEIINRLLRESDLDKPFIEKLFSLIFKESRKKQKK